MKVLIIPGEYPSKGAGGIGTVARVIGKELANKGIEYDFACSSLFKSRVDVDNLYFLKESGPFPFNILSLGMSFRHFIARNSNRWDILHFHLPNALGPLLYLPSYLRPRTLATFHTTAEGYLRYVYRTLPSGHISFRSRTAHFVYHRIRAWLERQASKKGRYTVAGSSGVREELRNWYGVDAVEVINNGIELDRLRGPELRAEGAPRVLYVGRLTSQKGTLWAVEALKEIQGDFVFVVVGTGPYRRRLEHLCEEMSIDCEFLGYVEDAELYNQYARADVLIMPSLYEGHPMVAMEAAGSGLPIVAFEGAKVRNTVCAENRRFIVPTGMVQELGRAIEFLLSHDEERLRISRLNRKRIFDKFDSRLMAEKYLRLYSRLQNKSY